MENAATMEALIKEIGYVMQGLVDSGYNEQFDRIIFNTASDFHIDFPESKDFFALFAENGALKYYAFDNQEDAEKLIYSFAKRLGDITQYRIVPRVIAEMLGREHEFYQYCETMADSDDEAAEYASKQQEIIDFLFPPK